MICTGLKNAKKAAFAAIEMFTTTTLSCEIVMKYPVNLPQRFSCPGFDNI